MGCNLGFVAVDKTMTVQGVYFDHKGRNTRSGRRNQTTVFMDDFIGEKLLEGSTIKVSKLPKETTIQRTMIKTIMRWMLWQVQLLQEMVSLQCLKKDIAMYVPYFKT